MERFAAPFPYFGGKKAIASEVWARFGSPKHYIEPFCGSAAMLLAAPQIASLEVISDWNGFIANFWRCVAHQPEETARWADYPVSHIDLTARHVWLTAQRARLTEALTDADWHGDPKVAGWWLWGQCAWIGSGWCEWDRDNPGGKIPSIGSGGMGIFSYAPSKLVPEDPRMMTSCGSVALFWLKKLQRRLNRVRILHGDWSRCLNNTYGGESTAVFLDPPYLNYEGIYSKGEPLSQAVSRWAIENQDTIRIALCGFDDYTLPGWDVLNWVRPTGMGQNKSRDLETVWFSPGCLKKEVLPPLYRFEAKAEEEDGVNFL